MERATAPPLFPSMYAPAAGQLSSPRLSTIKPSTAVDGNHQPINSTIMKQTNSSTSEYSSENHTSMLTQHNHITIQGNTFIFPIITPGDTGGLEDEPDEPFRASILPYRLPAERIECPGSSLRREIECLGPSADLFRKWDKVQKAETELHSEEGYERISMAEPEIYSEEGYGRISVAEPKIYSEEGYGRISMAEPEIYSKEGYGRYAEEEPEIPSQEVTEGPVRQFSRFCIRRIRLHLPRPLFRISRRHYSRLGHWTAVFIITCLLRGDTPL